MLASIAFAVFAVLGVHAAVKYRRETMNRVNYWYCTVSAGTHMLVALYLMWFGIIGIRLWA
jgi:ABC-type arginine/histidine transport system permease subunit